MGLKGKMRTTSRGWKCELDADCIISKWIYLDFFNISSSSTQKWFKGYGTDQYVYYAQQGEKKFLGGTFEVESYAELEKYIQPIAILLNA